MNNRVFKLTTLAIATSLLAACGGGGGGSSNAPSQPTISGRAVDGPLAGSLVTFLDCGEKTTETDNNGNFNFPQGCNESRLIVSGGIDTTTDLPFAGELKAPKVAPGQGNTIIASPLTTLIQASVDAGKTPEQATNEISAALGINLASGQSLLTVDPTKNKDVYAKTVAVQQLVEQIQSVVSSLGGEATQAELNTAAFTALQTALTNTSGSTPNLTNVETISSAISTTIEKVQAKLPADTQNNIANVKANVSALSAQVVAENVRTVQEAIVSAPDTAFTQGNIQAIKNATQAGVVEAKESIAAEKIVTALVPVLTQTLTPEAKEALQAISTAVASFNTTEISNALTEFETVAAISIPEEAKEAVEKANEFYADYLELNGFSAQATNYTFNQLASSLTNPIQISTLNNLLVGITGKGTQANTSITAAAALKISTATQTFTMTADQVNLTFTSGNLTEAAIPAGAQIKVDSSINALNTTITVNSTQDVLNSGKIALNTATLSKLSASFANQLNQFKLTGDTVTVTAVIKTPSSVVAIVKDNKPALASKYTLGTTDGSGVTAKFKVLQ
ncbi:hypothetical protein ABLT80_04355 [Acinetobacter schindleri]|uniref:hypothetical protein n=1 Tax=Acinetobacter schindleri TaxID=108981 RepID=UPI0032B3C28B